MKILENWLKGSIRMPARHCKILPHSWPRFIAQTTFKTCWVVWRKPLRPWRRYIQTKYNTKCKAKFTKFYFLLQGAISYSLMKKSSSNSLVSKQSNDTADHLGIAPSSISLQSKFNNVKQWIVLIEPHLCKVSLSILDLFHFGNFC